MLGCGEVAKTDQTSNLGVYTGATLTGDVDRSYSTQIDDEGTLAYFDNRFEYIYNNEVFTREYVLYRNENTIRIGTITVNDTTFTITPCLNYGDFEYRIYPTLDDYLAVAQTYDLSNTDTQNWNTLTSTGIIFDSEDPVDETIGESTKTYLRLFVRFKETTTTCYSSCYLVEFDLTPVEE